MKNAKRTVSLLMAVMLIFSMTACFKSDPDTAGLWDTATYTEDATVGEGEKTVEVEFIVEDRSVTVTIMTNKETLGEALYEHSLVNHPSFFDTANGIKADYNENRAWWKLCKDGEVSSVGIAELLLTDGDHYELIYTVGF